MEPELVFYDGHCGLCHGAVKFALERDADGTRFRFSPLQGEEIGRRLPKEERAALPDSLVVLTQDGRTLVRSDAALRMAERIGGGWAALAAVARAVPRPLRDLVYRFVASIRARLFAQPADVCPIVPGDLRERFLD